MKTIKNILKLFLVVAVLTNIHSHAEDPIIPPLLVLGIGMVAAPTALFAAGVDKTIDYGIAKSSRDASSNMQMVFTPIQQQLQTLDGPDIVNSYEKLMNNILQFEEQFEGVTEDIAYAGFKRSYNLLETAVLQKLLDIFKQQEANQNNSLTVAQAITPAQESSDQSHALVTLKCGNENQTADTLSENQQPQDSANIDTTAPIHAASHQLMQERMKRLEEDAGFFVLAKQKVEQTEQKKMNNLRVPIVTYTSVAGILAGILIYVVRS